MPAEQCSLEERAPAGSRTVVQFVRAHRGNELDAEAEYDVDGSLDMYESRDKRGHQVSCCPAQGAPAGDEGLDEQSCEALAGWHQGVA